MEFAFMQNKSPPVSLKYVLPFRVVSFQAMQKIFLPASGSPPFSFSFRDCKTPPYTGTACHGADEAGAM
jgi:hypothetical protein